MVRVLRGAIVGMIASSALNAQAPTVAVDHRVELITIAFKLAGAPEYSQNRFAPYIADIQRYFEPHKNHRAIEQVRAVRRAQPLVFDAVMSLAMNVSDLPELRPLVPFDRAPGSSRWQTPAAAALIDDVRAFAIESRAAEFFASHRALYDSASVRLGRLVAQELDADWFGKFFGLTSDRTFVIVPLLANSGTNFGPCVEPAGGQRTCYAIIAHERHDAEGFPTYDREVASTLVHEFTHGYANPAIQARMPDLTRSAGLILPVVAEALREQGYGQALSMMNEAMVRAVVGQYIHERQGPEREAVYLNEQLALGWLWVPELTERLRQYAQRRAQYPTMEAFMPRIVAYVDSLPARLPEMKRRYDATRPSVATLSIENGAESVDPALTQIAIRFDTPMRTEVRPSDLRPVGARDRLPQVSAATFDATATTLTLTVKLEAGRAYDFVLNRASGGRFTNVAGVPLAPYRIRFRTRAASSQ